jgi:hypothetical protein
MFAMPVSRSRPGSSYDRNNFGAAERQARWNHDVRSSAAASPTSTIWIGVAAENAYCRPVAGPRTTMPPVETARSATIPPDCGTGVDPVAREARTGGVAAARVMGGRVVKAERF